MFKNIINSIRDNKIKLSDIDNTNNIDYINNKIKIIGLYNFYYNIEKVSKNSYDIYCYITEKYEYDDFNPKNDLFPFILFNYNKKKNHVIIESFIDIINKEKSFLDSSRIIYKNKDKKYTCDYKITPIFKSYKNKKNIEIINLIDIIFYSKPNIYINEIYFL